MTQNSRNISNDKSSGRIQRQVVLPFHQSIRISLKQIKVRFFRSLITTLSLVLAVSFFSFVRVSGDIANGLLDTGINRYREQLIKSGYDLEPQDTRTESTPKQRWIIILSMLVCTVGIVNAQLMAVTERFREIGTMKCLGALDRFILRLFLLEAGMQGTAGAMAGALIGCLFSLCNNWLQFGTSAFQYVSFADVIVSVGISTLVGFLLSLAGVFYPAIVASRMQPVEAMRVEQ